MPKPNSPRRSFQALWLATGISSVGDGMVLVAFPLLALTLTRDPIAVAGVVVSGRVAALIASLPVGAVVDRVNRRRLVVGIEALRAVTMAVFGGVVLSGHDSLAAIYVAAFLSGALTLALDVIAGASLPEIVGPDELVTGNARLMTAELTGEELLGQAAGGAAFSVAASLPFVCDAVTFVASGSLLAYALPSSPKRSGSERLFASVLAGLRWLVADRLLRNLATVIGGLAYCQAMVFGILSLYVTGPLHLTAAGYGVFLAVAGSGNVVGALCAGRLYRRLGGGWCVIGAGTAAVAAYVTMALTSSALLAVVALTVETAAVIVGNVSIRSMRQTAAGPEMQGRAASAFQFLIMGALPLGSLTGGLVAGWLTIRGVLVAAAVLQSVILVAMATRVGGRRPAVDVGAPPLPPEPASELLDGSPHTLQQL